MENEPEKGSGIVTLLQKQKSNKKVQMAMVLAIIIGAVLIFVFWPKTTPSDPNAKKTASGKQSEEEIAKNLQAQVDAGMFSCEINPTPIFASGDSQGLLAIRNGPSNMQDMRVSIQRNDTGETVYTGTVLRPGEQKTEDRLSVILPPGDYPATACIEVLDPATKEVVANLEMALTLTIQT
ncbi:MAG: hypothetical protein RR869_02550 [Lachnospiraceae bacterium]